MQLGLREEPGQRLEQRAAQVEVVVRELEIEKRGFGLFELARHRQHVVGEAGGFGEGDVDHHHQLERLPAPRAS